MLGKKRSAAKAAIEKTFAESPSVSSWCRMCSSVADYVEESVCLEDNSFLGDEIFLKGLGYLSKSPKRCFEGVSSAGCDLAKVGFYTNEESMAMSELFSRLVLRLVYWACSQNGDEEIETENCLWPKARGIWHFFVKENKQVSVFKSPLGENMFRTVPFEALETILKTKLIRPTAFTVRPPVAHDLENDGVKQVLRHVEAIRQGVTVMASDALANGQARVRVGTEEEIRQEDEVLRRVRANGGKGLREFVRQVLQASAMKGEGGHPNTKEGRIRCYNRVYAILHPNRRSRTMVRDEV